jgi:hypothetical protein
MVDQACNADHLNTDHWAGYGGQACAVQPLRNFESLSKISLPSSLISSNKNPTNLTMTSIGWSNPEFVGRLGRYRDGSAQMVET